jgi:hypothetical protein
VACCAETCDYSRRILAREVARRIFIRYFKPATTSFDPVKEVFGQISKLIVDELNDEPFNPKLLACVKVQLLRKIKYGTHIPISDVQIQNTVINTNLNK